jgi:hypothetical protein
MPQRMTQKAVNTFVKGLITEAGELTFPEDASVDELNCDLRRDGSRRRRLGAEVEVSNTLSSSTIGDSSIVNTGNWQNVGGTAGLEYLVIQRGGMLYFYNKAAAPYSGQDTGHSVDLSLYEVLGSVGASTVKCQFTSINGALIVASEALNTIYIERDNVAETIAVTQIDFRTRDFEWLGEKSEYETGDAAPSDNRKYDTQNAGWVGTKGAAALSTYVSGHSSEYPPLTLPWYSGKDASGNYSNTEWDKIYSGSSLIGNGHFLLDFFNKDRATPSGLSIPDEVEGTRFTTVESFSGRVFYAGLDSAKNSSSVLFSRLVVDLNELGDCFQANDPTSEEFSDLLDDDGGVIRIAGAVGIKKLYSIGPMLLVFAENGVWSINGVDGVFRATEYSVKKVTEVGIASPQSFIAAEGTPIWWSRFGIHTLSFDSVSGAAQEQNISLPTIQSYWDAIGADSKSDVISVYDAINKRAYWAWGDTNETVTSKVNNFLVLDIPLQAFYPWRVSDEDTTTDAIVGISFYSGFGGGLTPLQVVDNAGNNVVDGSGNNVVSYQVRSLNTGTPAIVLLIRSGGTNTLTMGAFSNSDYYDWDNVDYSSYAVAGYEFLGDMILKKTAPYVATYMRVTETGWEGNESVGYDPLNPSSMMVSAYWDFKSTPSSDPQEAYRLKITPVVDPTALSTFGYPESVVTTRLKLRGRGRSMRLRFESTAGKDFVLLGYSVLGGVNARF